MSLGGEGGREGGSPSGPRVALDGRERTLHLTILRLFRNIIVLNHHVIVSLSVTRKTKICKFPYK